MRKEYVVYGNDHRGHGLTARASGSFGEFGFGGFNQLVDDMISVTAIAKQERAARPYILLGHSMGSFAAQQFISINNDDGCDMDPVTIPAMNFP